MLFHEPIHVLGAGSIGLLWTASIRSRFPTYPITLLLRDHDRNRKRVVAGATAAGNGKGNHVLDIAWNNRQTQNQTHPQTQHAETQRISLPVQFIGGTEGDRHGHDCIRTLIVATKAHQATRAVESVLDRLVLHPSRDSIGNDSNDKNNNDDDDDDTARSPTRIIVLCNGALSVRDELSKLLSAHTQTRAGDVPPTLALATTTHGAYLSGPNSNELVHAGVGTTFLEEPSLSSLSSSSSSLDSHNHTLEVWNQSGLHCTGLSPIEMNAVLWNKLAANCVINPLTSLFRCTNGELAMEPSFPELREQLLAEVARVAKAVAEAADAGAAANASNNHNHNHNRNNISGIPSIDEMRDFVTRTITATRDNKSSMYQDILRGNQTKTEIDHLNGYVVRKGRELGLDCPSNEDLCSRIAELTVTVAPAPSAVSTDV